MTSGSTYSATDSSTYAAQLRVAEVAVADQFVGQGPADAGKDEVPDGVFEDRAVPDFEDVPDVSRVAAGPGFGEAHVTEFARPPRQMLAGDFGVGLPGDAWSARKRSRTASSTVCRPTT